MGITNLIKALLAKLKALLEALLDQLDPDSVAINGAAIQNQILTADESDIDHDNGQPFTYQWQADGVNIAGATSKNYTLTQNDVGKHITLAVTYRNEQNQLVTLTSEQTAAVANVNDAVTGNVVITAPVGETFRQGILLTANAAALADLDGLGAFQYQWKANGVNIVGANNATYLLTQADVGKAISVVVSYIDGYGTAESKTSTNAPVIANVNDAPTGNVVIEGVAAINQLLTANTATIADLDGLGAFSYQWKANGIDINGATAATYLVTAAETGKIITVSVSYTDGFGAHEQLLSNVTGPVVGNSLNIFGQANLLLENGDVKFIGPSGNPVTLVGFNQLNLDGQIDNTVFVKDIINNLSINMGEGANDQDTVDLRDITGVTYRTSTNVFEDSSGSMIITNAENILLGRAGNNIIIDSGGDRNFIVDEAYRNNYETEPANNIKLIEGTGQGTIGISYINSNPNPTPVPYIELQRLSIDMEFNNTGPNIDNVATLDFAQGHYSFNYTLVELFIAVFNFTNINFQEAYQAAGELYVTLSDNNIDPITGAVTAKVTGLRDTSVQILDDNNQPADFKSWVFVENTTGEHGIADLTGIDASLYVSFNDQHYYLYEWENDPLTPLSNNHFFQNFEELRLGASDDVAFINFVNLEARNDIIDMGEALDGSDIDTLTSRAPFSYNGQTGLFTYNDTVGRSLHILNVEKIVGTARRDTIVGSNNDDIILADGEGAGGDNDIVEGAGGNDTIALGNAGFDTLVFGANSGHDIVSQFTANFDRFQLKDGVTIQNVEIVGNDTVVSFDAQNTVTLLGVQLALNDINII